jgi:hypothetical protein
MEVIEMLTNKSLSRSGRFAAVLMILALLVALSAVAAQGANPAVATATHLHAALSGAEEVPPADPAGTGTSNVFLVPETGDVCFTLSVSGITLPAAAAHIHEGEAGVAGGVVVPLAPPDETGWAAGCVTGVDPALVQSIIDNPAGYYVNVHNDDFPDGAVRGQLAVVVTE